MDEMLSERVVIDPDDPKLRTVLLTVPMDYFGVVVQPTIMAAIRQDGNRRAREAAAKSLFSLAKQFSLISKSAIYLAIGVCTTPGGYCQLTFVYKKG